MNRNDMESPSAQVIMGEMEDETICVRTGAGQVQRLWKDAPLHQRATFFDRLFSEIAHKEPVDASPFRALRASLQ